MNDERARFKGKKPGKHAENGVTIFGGQSYNFWFFYLAKL